jgi:hypothetical protein
MPLAIVIFGTFGIFIAYQIESIAHRHGFRFAQKGLSDPRHQVVASRAEAECRNFPNSPKEAMWQN